MAFVTADDETGSIDLTVFPQQFRKFYPLLTESTVVVVKGKVEERRGIQLLVDSIELARDLNGQRYFLRLKSGSSNQQKRELERLLRTFHGQVPVIVYDESTDRKVLLNENLWFTSAREAQQKVIDLLGENNVVLK